MNPNSHHRAYASKISCDFVVRVEPPLGVRGWGPDFSCVRDFEQNQKCIRILGFLKEFKVLRIKEGDNGAAGA